MSAAAKKPGAASAVCRRRDCAYYARMTATCDFRLVRGVGRGCPIEGCERYEQGTRKKATGAVGW